MKPVRLAPDVALDPMKLVDSRWLVCANSGAGKSYLLRLFCEQVVDRIPTIILDREGEFGTLREKHDVVLVGRGGEVETAVATAAKLARKLAELRVSAVIDLYDLRKPEKRKFVRLFLEALLALPRKLWAPTFVIIDEAHEFAPEAGRDAESRDAVIALMDQGRKRGLGGILATQRLSKLAKDAAGEANNLCIGRFAQDLDLRRASDLLGFAGRSEWATMRDSKPGEFYAVGPAFAHTGVARFKSDQAQTTHARAGQRYQVEPPRPSNAILKVAPELADLKQQVEAEVNELEVLRERVNVLQQENRKLAQARPDTREIDARAGAHALRDAVLPKLDELDAACRALRSAIGAPPPSPAPRREAAPLRAAPAPAPAPRRAIAAASDGGELGDGGMRRMMIALAQHPDGLDRTALGLLAGLSAQSGTFSTYLGRLRARGWVDADRSRLIATEAGVRALGHFEPLPTGSGLVDYWLKWVGQGGERRMLEVLVDAGDHGLSRNELAAAAGLAPASGTFSTYLGRLRRVNLIEGRDRLRAAATLRGAA